MGRKKKDKKAEQQFFAENEKDGKIKSEQVEGGAKKTGVATKPTPEQIEREYVGVLNYQRKQRDNLLGNYSKGEYDIPDELKAELLKIPKKFGEIEENIARVSTILGRFVLNFKIVFTIDPDVCNAKLYFIEIEHDIDDDIKHETLLDEFEQEHTFEFRKIVFEKWHVFYDDDVLVKDSLLKNYLHMQEEENLFFGELEMILSQLFVVRMLAFLDKMGELGEKIRFDFKLAMEKYLAKDPKFAQNFAFQKRLLDMFIAKHGALAVIAKDEEGAKILLGYSTPLKNVRDKTYSSPVVEPRKAKEEKKSEKKATKPTVKKRSGSPAKQAGFKYDQSKIPHLGMNFGSSLFAASRTPPAPQPRVQTPQPQQQPPQPIERETPPPQTPPVEKGTEGVGPWSKLVGGATTEDKQLKHDLGVGVAEELNPPTIKKVKEGLDIKVGKNDEDLALRDKGLSADKELTQNLAGKTAEKGKDQILELHI